MLLEFPITGQDCTAAEGEVSFEATCRSAILQEGIFFRSFRLYLRDRCLSRRRNCHYPSVSLFW